MSDSSGSLHLRDLGPLLMGLALDAKADAEQTGDAFKRGRSHGLYEAVSLIVQQADAFGLDRAEVGLSDVEPDTDLL